MGAWVTDEVLKSIVFINISTNKSSYLHLVVYGYSGVGIMVSVVDP